MSFTLSRGGPSRDEKSHFEEGDPDRLFRDLQEIGHGSFGAVYCAVDDRKDTPSYGQNVAIKKMSYSGRVNEKFGEIMKEVKLLQRIRNDYVVELIGTFLKEKEYSAWIIMEYCLGSVSDCVEVQPALLAEPEINQILRNILKGLVYLHSKQIIHRDIKAGNILLAETGVAKIGDFGSAASHWPANSFVGSPYWMAPEVIMAMEDGKYDGAADIWSLGITAIEIADKKPPLFSQNAMAALYQIAQSDPPALDGNNGWSQGFLDLVTCMLKKEPSERPKADELLEFPFFRLAADKPDIVMQLIRRTKKMVEEEEDNRHKRMVRILRDLPADSEGSLGSQKSRNDESSIKDFSDFTDSDSESQGSNSNQGSLSRRIESLPRDFHEKTTLAYEDSPDPKRLAGPPTIRRKPDQPQMTRPMDGHLRANQAFGSAVGSGFSTIRPVTLMKKEKEDQRNHSAFREQMGNYKKLRQEHRKIMMELEAKLEKEMENHQRNLQHELHRQRKKHEEDRHKQARKRHAHIEKISKDDELEERLFERHLDQKEEREKNDIDEAHKSEMKQYKQRQATGHSRQQLAMRHTDQRNQLEREQRQTHEMELRKWKRRRLIAKHNEEQKMFEEEMAEKLFRTEEENKLMNKHHDQTRQLEYNHMKAIHDMRLSHQVIQHNMEIDAQKEHMRSREQELKRRHQTAQKQAPKDLKDKDQILKKQFRDNIKVQDKQYKAFKNHVIETIPKREQQAVLKKVKTEKKRKMSLLYDQLEKARKDLHQDNSSRLHDMQKVEEAELRITLENDLKLLQKLQHDRRCQVIEMNKMEESALEKKVSLRLGLLFQRQDKQRKQHSDDRASRFRSLSDRQSAEIQKFDTESLRLGFNTVVVDTRSGNYYLLSPPEARAQGMSHEQQNQDRRLMPPDEVQRATSQHYRPSRHSHGGHPRDSSHHSSSSNHSSSSSKHRNGTSFY